MLFILMYIDAKKRIFWLQQLTHSDSAGKQYSISSIEPLFTPCWSLQNFTTLKFLKIISFPLFQLKWKMTAQEAFGKKISFIVA